jgi:hypothetical protein
VNQHEATMTVGNRWKPRGAAWLLRKPTTPSLAFAVAIACVALGGCASHPGGGYSAAPQNILPAHEEAAPADSERQLGIRSQGLRRSAAGYILDFRYRVTDPLKAVALLDSKVRPYLLDEASGAQLGVPDTAKLGQLRTTGRSKVKTDQNYFILFANPGRYVQPGSRMTLVMGEQRIENLVVE